jgi:hypothetical protein
VLGGIRHASHTRHTSRIPQTSYISQPGPPPIGPYWPPSCTAIFACFCYRSSACVCLVTGHNKAEGGGRHSKRTERGGEGGGGGYGRGGHGTAVRGGWTVIRLKEANHGAQWGGLSFLLARQQCISSFAAPPPRPLQRLRHTSHSKCSLISPQLLRRRNSPRVLLTAPTPFKMPAVFWRCCCRCYRPAQD